MQAQWTDSESVYSRNVGTAAEAVGLIKELGSSNAKPSMVEFSEGPDGLCLGYAVGRDKTVLTFQASLDPPYYISLAISAAADMWFYYAKEYTEYPGENMISHDGAERALREFFATKVLPSAIRWEKL